MAWTKLGSTKVNTTDHGSDSTHNQSTTNDVSGIGFLAGSIRRSGAAHSFSLCVCFCHILPWCNMMSNVLFFTALFSFSLSLC